MKFNRVNALLVDLVFQVETDRLTPGMTILSSSPFYKLFCMVFNSELLLSHFTENSINIKPINQLLYGDACSFMPSCPNPG